MAKGFAEALRRNSAEVADLEDAHAREFLKLLQGMEAELTARMTAIGSDPIDGFRLAQIDATAKAAIAQLQMRMNGTYNAAARESVDLAINHVGEELDRLSAAFEVKPLEVTLDASRALADPAQLLLANHFEASVQRYGLDVLNRVRQRVFIAMRTGDSTLDVVKGIRGLGIGRPEGERLVRTETSQAYGSAAHSGILQAAKRVPQLRKTWLHVASFLCKTCGPLHGTERPMDGTWTIKSGSKLRKVVHPPAHPNCTCRVTAMKPSWRAGLQKLGYLGDQPTTNEEGNARL